MTTFYVDFEDGNNNYGGTSFNPLASGTDGRISGSTFSSASASFTNDGSIATSKNLLAGSENLYTTDFTSTSWGLLNATSVKSSQQPPSGISSSVVEFAENTTSGIHYLANNFAHKQYILTIGETYTFSTYVKPNGCNLITIRFTSEGFDNYGARYNLQNGTIEQTGANVSATINELDNGWYRISITTVAYLVNQAILIGLTDNTYTSTNIQSYTGNGYNSIYLTAPQLEQGSSPTTYARTPSQYLSIFNGTNYSVYEVVQYLSSTSLHIMPITGGVNLANQAVDRQYYIGGRWKDQGGYSSNRTNPDDVIRVKASPYPTELGHATWTGNAREATQSIVSTTNASPIVVTVNNHGYSTGDIVRIFSHTINTNANGHWTITVLGTNSFTLDDSTGNGVGGATGTIIRLNNSVLRLGSAVTQNIASHNNIGQGRTAWTGSTNITTSLLTTDFKNSDCSDSIVVGASFTTGKAAHATLSSALDLSDYQQISFWIKQLSGTVIISGDISLRLCSDTLGNTSVHTINVPNIGLLNRWTPITVNIGSALSDNIQSVALYIDTDRGAQQFLICNILACKAPSEPDSLTLYSLVGKNTENEPWFPIASINNNIVFLESGDTNTMSSITTATSLPRGYFGNTENVLTYKRESIITPIPANTSTVVIGVNIPRNGFSFNSLIYFDGGWDRTNMSTRVDRTFFDGRSGTGYWMNMNQKKYVSISNVGLARYTNAIIINTNSPGHYMYNIHGCCSSGSVINIGSGSSYCEIHDSVIHSCSLAGIVSNLCPSTIIKNVICNNNLTSGITLSSCNSGYVENATCSNNGSYGIVISNSFKNKLSDILCAYNGITGIQFASAAFNNIIYSLTTSNNGTAGIAYNYGDDNVLYNSNIMDAIEFAFQVTWANQKLVSVNHDETPGYTYVFTDNGSIIASNAITHTGSGLAWGLSPAANGNRRGLAQALTLEVAKTYVQAGYVLTIKGWFLNQSTTLRGGLMVLSDQAGLTNNIYSYMGRSVNAWEEVTLSFTPTESGVVSILAYAHGVGSESIRLYVDDLTITQV